MHSFPLAVAAALTVIPVAVAARADDTSDSVRASALLEKGRQLMAAEDYAAACPKLAESQALDPAADTASDLGICYQKASQAVFKEFHDLARPPEQTAGVASASSRILAPVEASPPGQTQRIVGLTMGGAGVAGIVAGVITGLMAKSAYDRSIIPQPGPCAPCGQSQRDSAVDLARASTISLVTGAVAVGAGGIVFFTAPKSKKSGAGATVGLAASAEGTGLSIAGRF